MRQLGQGDLYRDAKAIRVALGLGQPAGWLPFAVYTILPGSPMTTSPDYPFAVTIARAMTIRSWHQGVYVATTNNGSNYWTLDLLRWSDLGTLASLNTSAISADTATVLSSTGLSVAVATSYLSLLVRVTKTGSPGGLYAQGPAVWVT